VDKQMLLLLLLLLLLLQGVCLLQYSARHNCGSCCYFCYCLFALALLALALSLARRLGLILARARATVGNSSLRTDTLCGRSHGIRTGRNLLKFLRRHERRCRGELPARKPLHEVLSRRRALRIMCVMRHVAREFDRLALLLLEQQPAPAQFHFFACAVREEEDHYHGPLVAINLEAPQKLQVLCVRLKECGRGQE
jgi:hypothetical protein